MSLCNSCKHNGECKAQPAPYMKIGQCTMYEKFPQPGEYSGEGLPPVGVLCEMKRAGEGFASGAIMYLSDQLLVWRFENGNEIALRDYHCEFRPLKTKEQQAEDDAVAELVTKYGMFRERAMAAYQAGWRKVSANSESPTS